MTGSEVVSRSMSRSNTASHYRTVGASSRIDDDLFGTSTKKRRGRKNGPIATDTSVVVSESELQRIKQLAILRTPAEIEDEKKRRDNELQEKQRKARERKERMLEMAKNAEKLAQKSDIQIINEAREQALRELAKEKMLENTDLVKHLRALGAQAAAFTIRDKQLEDKARVKQAEKEYEKRMDMLMEIDRLQDLRRREVEEQEKLQKRISDRQVIIAQMEEAHRRTLLEAEAREQENQAMLAMIRRYQEEDQAKTEKRKHDIERAKHEVVAANEAAIARKKQQKQQEIDEVQAILRYQALKDEELRVREEEEAAKECIRKETQAKLLAMQEKSKNKQVEMDEVRARRAAEEKERQARQKERAEAEKRRQDQIELNKARQQQAMFKAQATQREAELERTLNEQTNKYIAQTLQREEIEARQRMEQAERHREALRSQITEAEQTRRAGRNRKFQEGRTLREESLKDRAQLEAIRDKMVNDLKVQGINPRYLAEMEALDIGRLQHKN